MANTETSVSNLKINRLTQTQLENASSLSNTEAYWVDPEFTGGKVLITDSNGDIVESTVSPSSIGTVKSVNNTSPDSNGNVSLTIPTVNNATLTITQGGTTKGTFTANASSNVTVNLDGNQRNIGEIIQSTIPLTDAGLHILDGGIINGSGIYADFVTYIAGISSSYPDLFTTEANWQTALSTYGVCGKFVYDSVNNTVRLPKYSNKIYTQELDANAPVIGNGAVLGFTSNKTDFFGLYCTDARVTAQSELNPTTSQLPQRAYSNQGTPNGLLGVSTDTTKSGLIAQLSDITTSLDGYYYIVVATTSKTDIQVDIDEIATDLNGKVGKADCYPIYPVIETYKSGASWYRIYSDGWCEQGGQIDVTENYGYHTINLVKTYSDTNYSIQLSVGLTDYDRDICFYKPSVTTSSFQIYFGSNVSDNHTGIWQTAGYLASGQYTGGTYKAYKP